MTLNEEQTTKLEAMASKLEAKLEKEIRHNIGVSIRKAADSIAKFGFKEGWEGKDVIDIYWSWGQAIREEVNHYLINSMETIHYRTIAREELDAHIEKKRAIWKAEAKKAEEKFNQSCKNLGY